MDRLKENVEYEKDGCFSIWFGTTGQLSGKYKDKSLA